METFVVVRYGNLDLLINRRMVYTSLYMEEFVPVESAPNRFIGLLPYQDGYLPLFDIDSVIQSMFHLEIRERSSLIVLMETKGLRSESGEKLDEIIKSLDVENLKKDRIAILLGNESYMETVPSEDIKPFPLLLRKLLEEGGFYGVSMKEAKRARYFIDLDRFLFTAIL